MKKASSFLAGFIAALLLVSMIGSAAAYVGTITKKLNYNNISVSLNGKRLDLRDAKGNAVDPFIIDGTTYLPVRALSEALGLSVAWDSSTSTVVLGTQETTTKSAAYKALSEWLRNNHLQTLSDGSTKYFYAARSKDGDTGYGLGLDDSGELIVMCQYKNGPLTAFTTITLSEFSDSHTVGHSVDLDNSHSFTLGTIDAAKLSETDGFQFDAPGDSEKEKELNEKLARYGVLSALAFMDDVLVDTMDSEYDLSSFGFVRENISK